jgi:hypothetical protein
MSDRPSAINGKRNQSWGTLRACPACGQCLCFGCHPAGPCVDDAARDDAAASRGAGAFTSGREAAGYDVAWFAGESSEGAGVAGLRLHGGAGSG